MNKTFPLLKKSKLWLANLTVGGSWGRTLQQETQHNLRWFWFDGLFASASDNIVLNFISLYILTLGASEIQVGLLSSFSSIACALVLLPGATLAERFARRKLLPLFTAIGARLMIVMLVFVPILFKGPSVVWIAIAFSVIRDTFTNLGWPAWMSVTNDTVPIEGRGRFFGSRNFIMSITGMIATLLAGKLITIFIAPLGYQIAFAAAFVLGMSSTFSYAHIREQNPHSARLGFPKISRQKIADLFKGRSQFVALMITAALWNFGVNISGPFFNVYMVKNLKFSAASVGFLAVVTSFTTLTTQNQFGALADRLSSRRLQLASMCIIPLLPLAWVFSTQVWHITIINAVSGVVWGAFNLVSFNLLLATIPENQVPRFSAIYQAVVMLSLAAGALVGNAIISRWSFIGVFIASALFRYLATALFAKLVHEPKKPNGLSRRSAAAPVSAGENR
jgi:MFS family permease